MVAVVEGGSDVFDSLAYGRPQAGIYDFLAQRAMNLSYNLTQAGQQFVQTVKNYYTAMTESDAARLARAAGRKVRSLWDMDDIRPLFTMGDFQHAGITMQRWVMAEPSIRQAYHEQRCEGYADSYVDWEPGRVGEQHYDYRRVMNGIATIEDDGWYAKTFIEELLPNDRELNIDEQADILRAWREARYHLAQGKEDPTSRYNAHL